MLGQAGRSEVFLGGIARDRVSRDHHGAGSAEPNDVIAYRVAILEEPRDAEVADELREILREALDLHPTDAAVYSRRLPGLLPAALSHERSKRAQAAIARLGLAADIFREESVPRVEHARVIHQTRHGPEGIEWFDLHGQVGGAIRWNNVGVIATGEAPDGKQTRHPELAHSLSKRRPASNKVELDLPLGWELWFSSVSPFALFRIEHRHMNYDCLGDRKTDSAWRNFRLLLGDLVTLAPAEAISPSVLAILSHDPSPRYRFRSVDEIKRHVQVCLLKRMRS